MFVSHHSNFDWGTSNFASNPKKSDPALHQLARSGTPGYAVKALIGDMVGHEGRRPLYNVANPFMSAPNDLLFGEKVDVRSLGGRAFSRNLDQLFTLDLPGLTYE